MTLYQVNNNEPATSYKIEGKDFPLESIAVRRTELLISKEAGVDVYTTAPSAVGPRGRAFTYEDFTPEQLEGLVGPAGTIEVGTVTTGAAGTQASIVNVGTAEHAVLDFTIPKGDQGIQGIQGIQGEKGDKGDTGLQGPKGDQGPQGPKGDRGENGVQGPAGQTGPAGPQGPQGPKGNNGSQGPAGTAATISIGTVTTGQPGTQVSVTNSGTSTNAVLNFSIPRGNDGAQGPAGAVSDVMVSYDQGATWQSAMVGNVAKVITGTGGGGGGGQMNVIEVVQKNGTALPVVNKTVNVTVPTATSQLTNDSGFITSSQIPSVPIESISINGTPQTITNKNVDLPAIPTADQQPAPSTYTKAFYAANADNAGTAMYMDLVGLQNANDLKAIEALSGTSGLLRKTGENTWTLDTNTYATTSSLANVATTGSYNDLTNKPTIPAAQVNADWNAVSGIAEILNKPTIPGFGTPTASASTLAEGASATASVSASGPDSAKVYNFAFGIPKGDTGDPGIYYGTNTPTNPNVNFWIDPSGDPTSGIEMTSNKVTTISSSSTDTEYPSAKAVYDSIPAQGQVASGNTGYVTGGDVFSSVSSKTEFINYSGATYRIPSGHQLNDILVIYMHHNHSSYTSYYVGVETGSAEKWFIWCPPSIRGFANSGHSVLVGSGSGSGDFETTILAIRAE